MREVWIKAMCKELGRLSQGYSEKGSDYHTEGMNTVRLFDHEGIVKTPRDRIVIYAIIEVD